MFKQLVTGSALSFIMLSGAAQAIEGSVDVGEHSTNLNVGLGTTSPGLFLNGNWLRSDHDGSTYGAVSYTHLDVYKRQVHNYSFLA